MKMIAGAGGMPAVDLTSPDGASARVYLHGAHLTSWIPARGRERLYLSPLAEFRPGAAIRGGAPVIFPQFAGQGPLPKHGFARTSPWKFGGTQEKADGSLQARFELGETPASHALWPHPFRAWLELALGGRQLSLTLRVENSGEAPFPFTAALHTYLRVGEIAQTAVGGLGGAAYLDNAAGGLRRVQAEDWLRFEGEVDRIYLGPFGALVLQEAGQETLSIQTSGFPDEVTWNPGPLKAAALADLEPGGWRQMVCIEAAAASAPLTLDPGQTWEGMQVLNSI